jgi:hypothetical protein
VKIAGNRVLAGVEVDYDEKIGYIDDSSEQSSRYLKVGGRAVVLESCEANRRGRGFCHKIMRSIGWISKILILNSCRCILVNMIFPMNSAGMRNGRSIEGTASRS